MAKVICTEGRSFCRRPRHMRGVYLLSRPPPARPRRVSKGKFREFASPASKHSLSRRWMCYRHARAAVSQARRIKSTVKFEFCTGCPINHRTSLPLSTSPMNHVVLSIFHITRDILARADFQCVERKSAAIDDVSLRTILFVIVITY